MEKAARHPLSNYIAPNGLSYGIVQPGAESIDGVPMLRVKDLGMGSDLGDVMRIDRKVEERYSRTRLVGGELLLSVVGSPGVTHVVGDELIGFNVARAIAVIRLEGVEPEWVNLCFSTSAVRAQVSAFLNTTVQATLNLADVRRVEVDVPARHHRMAVIEVLGSLDHKIAVNQRAIRAADSLARARANQAAVRSPQSPLGDVCTVISRGVAPRYAADGYLVLNQKCVREGRVDLQKSRTMKALPRDSAKILQSEDVLVNSTGQGTLGRVARWTKANAKVSVDSHITIVRVDENVADPSFVGALLLDYESRIEALAEGSTGQTELGRQALTSLPLRLPPMEEQQEVGDLVRSLSRLMDAKEEENHRLAATRDELLPLLMSGKITVKDAEKTVEGVV